MSYTKTTWSDGDIITANKMNNIETGVESLNTDVGQLQTDLDSLTETVENLPTGGGDVPADYQELVDDVTQIKADLSELTDAVFNHPYAVKSHTEVTSLDLGASAQAYTKRSGYITYYIPVIAGHTAKVSITCNSALELRFGFSEDIPAENVEATYINYMVGSGVYEYSVADDGYFSVSRWTGREVQSIEFALTDDNLPDTVKKHTNQIEYILSQETDKTLTQEDVPADAKTVGMRLDETDEFLFGTQESAVPITAGLNLNENGSKYVSSVNHRTHYFQVSAFEEWTFTITAAKAGDFRFGYCATEPENNVPAKYIDKITIAKNASDTFTMTLSEDGYISVSHYHDLLSSLSVSGLSGGKNKDIAQNTKDISTIGESIEQINTDFKLKRTIYNKEIISLLKAARHVPSHDGEALVLVHFSDIHGDTGALHRILNDVQYIGDVDDIICTGDMVEFASREIESWWEPTVLTTIGNHDAGTNNGGVWDYKGVPMADRDALFIAPFEENWNVVHTPGTSYYYKDYTTKNIRLIALDPQLYLEETAETTAQTSWFENLLSDANTRGLHVLVAVHGPVQGGSCLSCSFNKYNYQGGIADGMSYTPTSIAEAVAAEKALGLNFIGYISGHKHEDYLHKPTNDQIEVNITCATPGRGSTNDVGTIGTDNPYNLLVIDTRNTLLKIIRGGDTDYDIYMRPRKAISFNYSTGDMIAEIL